MKIHLTEDGSTVVNTKGRGKWRTTVECENRAPKDVNIMCYVFPNQDYKINTKINYG